MKLLISLLMMLVLAGCGSGGGDTGGSPPNPNTNGNGWLSIDYPTSNDSFQTEHAAVTLRGGSFTPPGTWFSLQPPRTYSIRWENATTGEFGTGGLCYDCTVTEEGWGATIPLAMGANSITVSADDGAGDSGRDSITVTRVVDTISPLVTSVDPTNGSSVPLVILPFVIEFNEPMSVATINSATILLTDGFGQPVPATISAYSTSATLLPLSPLVSRMAYHLTVTTGVQDASGNPLTVPFNSYYQSCYC